MFASVGFITIMEGDEIFLYRHFTRDDESGVITQRTRMDCGSEKVSSNLYTRAYREREMAITRWVQVTLPLAPSKTDSRIDQTRNDETVFPPMGIIESSSAREEKRKDYLRRKMITPIEIGGRSQWNVVYIKTNDEPLADLFSTMDARSHRKEEKPLSQCS